MIEKVKTKNVAGNEFTCYVRDDDSVARDSCLRYLRDCGFEVVTEVVPESADNSSSRWVVTWGELSDVLAPRDD